MINILSFWSDIGFSIKQALRTFSGIIASILYDFIIDLYNVFMYTARAEILEDSFIQQIYNKVGMILGLFMVFKLAFSLIQSLVDPNKFSDEKAGFAGIIKRSVIAVVLLGITPSIFDMAFDLQNLIVGSANDTDNIIYKLIVGSSPSQSAESFGHTIATELYFGFYTENDPLKLDQGLEVEYPDSGGAVLTVHNYAYLKSAVASGAISFRDTVEYLSITSGGQYVIKWNELFAIGFAIFMIYILISYCIQVATRVIQLAYLQLIAPVPILSYISDPEGAFKNWIKQCTTTYLDLFIRLAIIYFIITVSTMILDAVNNTDSVLFTSTGLEEGSSTLFWVKLFLIIGLLMFGKRVPDLFKDLFPNLGGGAASLGFGGTKLKDIPGANKALGFAKGAATFGLGAAVGGIAGMATGIKHGEGFKGKVAGLFGGLGRGIGSARTKGNIFKNAGNGINSTRLARQRAYEKNHDGSTFWGRHVTAGSNARTAAEFERELESYKDYQAQADIVDKELEKNAAVQQAMAARDALMQRQANGGAAPTIAEIQAANDNIKAMKETALQAEMTTRSNATIQAALANAEQLRRDGVKKGYKGYGNNDVTQYADDFNDTKKSTKTETNNITGIGGTRNEEYKKAKANAKYNKGGK